MVLALLTIIRPLQVPPVWNVQKAAAQKARVQKALAQKACTERAGKSARPHPRTVKPAK